MKEVLEGVVIFRWLAVKMILIQILRVVELSSLRLIQLHRHCKVIRKFYQMNHHLRPRKFQDPHHQIESINLTDKISIIRRMLTTKLTTAFHQNKFNSQMLNLIKSSNNQRKCCSRRLNNTKRSFSNSTKLYKLKNRSLSKRRKSSSKISFDNGRDLTQHYKSYNPIQKLETIKTFHN